MSDKDIQLSRRKILAGLGTIGVASAGAGLGTTAWLSDEESFLNNSLSAGTLDLKLDYKATYMGGPGRLGQVQAMGYPDAEYLGDGTYLLDQAPSPADMQEWEDLVQGEQFPFCSPDADEFLVNGDDIPVFTLEDVKPGDCGEVTISLHLCDNPGYIQMSGSMTSSENGQTEPELDAEGEDTDGEGELADAIQVCMWYDEDCDNVFESSGEEGQELEVALVSDTSGSMSGSIGDLQNAATGFVDNLASPDEAAAISFTTTASTDQELTTDYAAVKNAINGYTAGGGTDISAGIAEADNELINGTNATPGASKVMILLSDGNSNESAALSAAQAAKDNGIRIFTIALGSANTSLLEDIASSPGDAYVAPDPSDLDAIYQEISEVVLEGEQEIFCGSMADAFAMLSGGVLLDGDRNEDGVQPYAARTTQCIGFEWCLPEETGNEIQSDSVSFDLTFEAEQARHNDNPFGSNATTTPTTTQN